MKKLLFLTSLTMSVLLLISFIVIYISNQNNKSDKMEVEYISLDEDFLPFKFRYPSSWSISYDPKSENEIQYNAKIEDENFEVHIFTRKAVDPANCKPKVPCDVSFPRILKDYESADFKTLLSINGNNYVIASEGISTLKFEDGITKYHAEEIKVDRLLSVYQLTQNKITENLLFERFSQEDLIVINYKFKTMEGLEQKGFYENILKKVVESFKFNEQI